jgi:hypothetical protein
MPDPGSATAPVWTLPFLNFVLVSDFAIRASNFDEETGRGEVVSILGDRRGGAGGCVRVR